MNEIDLIPLWLVFAITIGLALGCIECGFRLGERRKNSGLSEAETPLGSMVGATLGLLAFLLAFTFNIAVGRYDDRRLAVLDEANAIGTTYLRAEYLDDPVKTKVQKLLREYVQLRKDGIVPSQINQLISQSENLQQQLWAEAVVVAKAHPNFPVNTLFISSLNEVIDLHSKRIAFGIHARVPFTVWISLLLVAGLSMAGVGYFCGLSGRRSWPEVIVLVSTFGIVMFLVADLDRPQQGLLRTSQQPMIELNQKLGPP